MKSGIRIDNRIAGRLTEIQTCFCPRPPVADNSAAEHDKVFHGDIGRILRESDVVHIRSGLERHVFRNEVALYLQHRSGGDDEPLHVRAVADRQTGAGGHDKVGSDLAVIEFSIAIGDDTAGKHECLKGIDADGLSHHDVVDARACLEINMIDRDIVFIMEIGACQDRHIFRVRTVFDRQVRTRRNKQLIRVRTGIDRQVRTRRNVDEIGAAAVIDVQSSSIQYGQVCSALSLVDVSRITIADQDGGEDHAVFDRCLQGLQLEPVHICAGFDRRVRDKSRILEIHHCSTSDRGVLKESTAADICIAVIIHNHAVRAPAVGNIQRSAVGDRRAVRRSAGRNDRPVPADSVADRRIVRDAAIVNIEPAAGDRVVGDSAAVELQMGVVSDCRMIRDAAVGNKQIGIISADYGIVRVSAVGNKHSSVDVDSGSFHIASTGNGHGPVTGDGGIVDGPACDIDLSTAQNIDRLSKSAFRHKNPPVRSHCEPVGDTAGENVQRAVRVDADAIARSIFAEIDRAAGIDRGGLQIAAGNVHDAALKHNPILIASGLHHIRMVEFAVPGYCQVGYFRIRCDERAILVKEYAIRVSCDVGGDSKTKRFPIIHAERIRHRIIAERAFRQGKFAERLAVLTANRDRAGKVRRIPAEDVRPEHLVQCDFHRPGSRSETRNIADHDSIFLGAARQSKHNIRIGRIDRAVHRQVRPKTNGATETRAVFQCDRTGAVRKHAVRQHRAASDRERIDDTGRRDYNCAAVRYHRAPCNTAVLNRHLSAGKGNVFQNLAPSHINIVSCGNDSAPDRAGTEAVIHCIVRKVEPVHKRAGFDLNTGYIAGVVHIDATAGLDHDPGGAAIPVQVKGSAIFDRDLVISTIIPVVSCVCTGRENGIRRRAVAYHNPAEYGRITGDRAVAEIKTSIGVNERIAGRMTGIQRSILHDDATGNNDIAEGCEGSIRRKRNVVEFRAGLERHIVHRDIIVGPQDGSGGDIDIRRRAAAGNIHAAGGTDRHIACETAIVNIETVGSADIREDHMVRRAAAGNIDDAGVDDGFIYQTAIIDPEPAALHDRAASRCPGVRRRIVIRRHDHSAERVGGKGRKRIASQVDPAAVFNNVCSGCAVGNIQVAAIVDGRAVHCPSGRDIHAVFPSGTVDEDIVCRAAIGDIDPSVEVDCRVVHHAAAGDIDPPVGSDRRAVHHTAALNRDHRGVFHGRILHHAAFVHDRAVGVRDRHTVQFIALLNVAGHSPAVIHVRIAILVCHVRAVIRDDGAAPGIELDCRGRTVRNDQGPVPVDIDVIRRAVRFDHSLCAGLDMQFGSGTARIDDRAVPGFDGKDIDGVGLEDHAVFVATVIELCITVVHGHDRPVFHRDRTGPRGEEDVSRTATLNGQHAALVHIHAVHHAAFVHDRAVAARDIQRIERIRPADQAGFSAAVVHVRFPFKIGDRRIAVRRNAPLPRIEHDAGAAVPVHIKSCAGIHRDAIECAAGSPGISAGHHNGLGRIRVGRDVDGPEHGRGGSRRSAADVEPGLGIDDRIDRALFGIQVGITLCHGPAGNDESAHRIVSRIRGEHETVHECAGKHCHTVDRRAVRDQDSGAGGNDKTVHRRAAADRERTAGQDRDIGSNLAVIDHGIGRRHHAAEDHKAVHRLRGNSVLKRDIVDPRSGIQLKMAHMGIRSITEIAAECHRHAIRIRPVADLQGRIRQNRYLCGVRAVVDVHSGAGGNRHIARARAVVGDQHAAVRDRHADAALTVVESDRRAGRNPHGGKRHSGFEGLPLLQQVSVDIRAGFHCYAGGGGHVVDIDACAGLHRRILHSDPASERSVSAAFDRHSGYSGSPRFHIQAAAAGNKYALHFAVQIGACPGIDQNVVDGTPVPRGHIPCRGNMNAVDSPVDRSTALRLNLQTIHRAGVAQVEGTAAADDRAADRTGILNIQGPANADRDIFRISAAANEQFTVVSVRPSVAHDNIICGTGHKQIDAVDDLSGRDDAAVPDRDQPVADAAGKIRVFQQAAAENRHVSVGIRLQAGYDAAFGYIHPSVRFHHDPADDAAGTNVHHAGRIDQDPASGPALAEIDATAGMDRERLHTAAVCHVHEAALLYRPSGIVACAHHIDMIACIFRPDRQFGHVRIRCRKGRILVKEHAVGTSRNIRGYREAESGLFVQRQTV